MLCASSTTRPSCFASSSYSGSNKISRRLNSTTNSRSIRDSSRLRNFRCSKRRVDMVRMRSRAKREVEGSSYKSRTHRCLELALKTQQLDQLMVKRATSRLGPMLRAAVLDSAETRIRQVVKLHLSASLVRGRQPQRRRVKMETAGPRIRQIMPQLRKTWTRKRVRSSCLHRSANVRTKRELRNRRPCLAS